MGCGQLCDGFYCYLCTCQQCGFSHTNGTCMNCTYGDGKPVTCCKCESPLNGGFCLFCASRTGNSSVYDPNTNSYNDSPDFSNYTSHPQYETYICEFPQTLPSLQQQILCCENYGGHHATFECQLMNQYFHDSNSSGFDQFQPLQFPVMHQPSEESIKEFEKHLKTVVISILEGELADFINTPNWNRPAFCNNDNDDDDEEYTIAITPVLPTKEPVDSLIIEDEHLDTILTTESDEVIKSSVENLVQNPSESKDEFYLIHNEDLDSTLKNDRFDTESYLLESLLNRDTLMASSPKIDSLLDEFSGELITIPPRIVREHEEYISMMERLLYDNSSPRLPESFQANSNMIIESLPTFPIPVKDSDSLREEIDIFPGPDDSIPLGIKSDDYDSEGDDILTFHLPEVRNSFHVDYLVFGRFNQLDVVNDHPRDCA
ncbi:hypothetical protein Tco_1046759 [Tanacetum coccineum]